MNLQIPIINTNNRRRSINVVQDEKLKKLRKSHTLRKGVKHNPNSPFNFQSLQDIKTIFQLPPKQRSQQVLQKVVNLTKDLKFFQYIRQQYSQQTHSVCCKFLKYQFAPQQAHIFQSENTSQQLFIILKGKAKIIPLEQPKKQKMLISQGDSSLKHNLHTTKNFTVKSISDLHLAVMSLTLFQKTIEQAIDKKTQAIVDLLKTIPALKNYSRNFIKRLTDYCKSLKYKPNQYVFREGEKPLMIYLVQSGEFRISCKTQIVSKSPQFFPRVSKLTKKRHQRESQLASIVKGQIIGEDDLTSKKRKNSCKCVYQGYLLGILKEDFVRHFMRTDESQDYFRSRIKLKTEVRQSILEKDKFTFKLMHGIIPLKSQKLKETQSRFIQSSSQNALDQDKILQTIRIKSKLQEYLNYTPRPPSSLSPQLIRDAIQGTPKLRKKVKNSKKKERPVVNIHTWYLRNLM